MAYVKTTWETGDVITAEKLNNMEGGIEALQPMIVVKTQIEENNTKAGNPEFTLDKTYTEIMTALQAGVTVFICLTDVDEFYRDMVVKADYYQGVYEIVDTANVFYYSSTADGTLSTKQPE